MSAPVPASSFGAAEISDTDEAMLPSTVSMRSANGRAASAAACARRSFDAATICMALVIFCVALVAAIRTRMSLREAISVQSPSARPLVSFFVMPGLVPGRKERWLRKRLGVTVDNTLQLGRGGVAEIAGLANIFENIAVLGADETKQTVSKSRTLLTPIGSR